eukprot:c414_g1_i1.p1 GENE.c414_g1_i1~~c414_g1_i1.p1  ORF type:complete len:515 (-),score=67.35 c414_g1_i1:132-1550(-)
MERATQRPSAPRELLSLPSDLIVATLRCLNTLDLCRVAQCCKRLYVLSFDARLSRSWEIQAYARRRIQDSTLRFLATWHLEPMHACDLTGCQLVSDNGLRAVTHGFPQLEEIRVAKCTRISLGGLAAAVSDCPELQVLDVRIAKQHLEAMNGNALLMRIAQRALPLRHLDLRGLVVDSASLLAVVRACPAIADLYFTGRGVRGAMRAQDLVDLMAEAKSLKRLYAGYMDDLDRAAIASMVAASASLEALKLEGLAIAVPQRLSLSAPSVRALHLELVEILDGDMARLLAGLPQLRSLIVRHCTYISEQWMEPGLSGLRFLEELRINGCPVADAAVSAVANLLPSLRLRVVDLSHTNITEQALPTLLKIAMTVPCVEIADCAEMPALALLDFYKKKSSWTVALRRRGSRDSGPSMKGQSSVNTEGGALSSGAYSGVSGQSSRADMRLSAQSGGRGSRSDLRVSKQGSREFVPS